MTTRNQGPGGRIPADGRQPRAPGVGKNARRHDLEQPKTPGLSDSDLQQGDVQMLENAQRIAPATTQQPARGGGSPASQPQQASGVSAPDPLQFADQRLKGSLTQLPQQGTSEFVDPTPWMPLLRQLASNPSAGGTLTQAYIEQLSNLQKRPAVVTHVVNLNDLDDALEASL